MSDWSAMDVREANFRIWYELHKRGCVVERNGPTFRVLLPNRRTVVLAAIWPPCPSLAAPSIAKTMRWSEDGEITRELAEERIAEAVAAVEKLAAEAP